MWSEIMTILICTGFYIYVIFSVNVYRKEIVSRANEGYRIKGKVKAPYPLRISVLLALVALAINIFLFQFTGNEMTIIINTFPVLFCTNLLGAMSAESRKSTGRICDVLLQEKANVDIRR